jgi:3-oxoacyl-[acyl-carrier-protein] synthase II
MGFGGSNAVALIAGPGVERRRRSVGRARIAIVGCGIVSSLGHGLGAFRDGLWQGKRALGSCELGERRTPRLVARVPQASRVATRSGRTPRARARLRDFAVAAASEALGRAGLESDDELARTALVVSMAHGPVAAQQVFFEGACSGPQTVATGRQLLDMSRFAVVSDLCQALRLRGFSTSLAGGIGSGLQALICAAELLQADPGLRFALVVAVDELCPLYLELFERLGVLAAEERGFAPYDQARAGLVLGEGATAFVLERQASDRVARTADCVIAGRAVTCDARGFGKAEADGSGLRRAFQGALREAGRDFPDLQGFYGSGRGLAGEDARELSALRGAGVRRTLPIGGVTGNVGVPEAGCSLLAVAAASISLRENALFPALTQGELPSDVDFVRGEPRVGDYRRLLVGASSEDGVNSAVVLERA